MNKSIVGLAALALSLSSICAQEKLENAFVRRENAPRAATAPVLFQSREEIPHRSVLLAATLSLLVPGTGEMYAGGFESGKYSLLAEGAIWITYASFMTHGNWVRRDARVFATEHAGANFTSKSDKFDVDIGNYLSLDDYNQAKLRNRDLDMVYTDPSYQWKWDSDADRVSFKNARIRSDQTFQNAKFVIAAAVVNRLYSAFSAGRTASTFNRKALIEGAWNLNVYPTSTRAFADGIAADISVTF